MATPTDPDEAVTTPTGARTQGGAGGGGGGGGGDGGGGGGGFPPQGFPNTPGNNPNTPIYVITPPKTISTRINPYGAFTDMGEKDQRLRFEKAIALKDDAKAMEVTVMNAKKFVNTMFDKATTFRWYNVAEIPTSGDGAIYAEAKIGPDGVTSIFNVNLGDFKNLVDDFHHLTMDQVMAYVAWFMGDATQTLTKHASTDDHIMKSINPNAAGNGGLVDIFKQQLRITSQLIWLTIKNYITETSYRSFLVHKKDFMYTEQNTGEVYMEGFTLLKKIFTVMKPDVIVDVADLEAKMKKITILTADNNMRTLATKMEELQQEINAQRGEDYYKDDTFLTELYRAAGATTNEEFGRFVKDSKTKWVIGAQRDKSTIVNDMLKVYRNAVHDGTWGKTSDKDTKIMALTTRLETSKNRMNELEKRIKKIADGGKAKDTSKSNGDKIKSGGGEWQFKKVGQFKNHPETGAKYEWCDKGHGDGAYMPHPHDHKKWEEGKAAKRAARAKGGGHRDKRVRFETNGQAVNKLALNDSLRAALVTRCHMTPDDADKIFADACSEAASKE